jgi:hypothetical protein
MEFKKDYKLQKTLLQVNIPICVVYIHVYHTWDAHKYLGILHFRYFCLRLYMSNHF